jgi:hypothetical protein
VLYPLADQFYGDRAGCLRDPFGQQSGRADASTPSMTFIWLMPAG